MGERTKNLQTEVNENEASNLNNEAELLKDEIEVNKKKDLSTGADIKKEPSDREMKRPETPGKKEVIGLDEESQVNK